MKKLYIVLFCLIIQVMLCSCTKKGNESSTLIKPGIAETQEDARAQYLLGRQYYWGQGVSQDSHEALKWFRKSAEEGNADAQFSLGCMYYLGDGVGQDYIPAYMWFYMAAAQGNEKAREFRDVTAGKMTPAQIEEARNLVNEQDIVRGQPD